MVIVRPHSILPVLAFAAVLASPLVAPSVALADDTSRVASIAAKGQIPAIVPVETGLAFGLGAALVALGMNRRARRSRA